MLLWRASFLLKHQGSEHNILFLTITSHSYPWFLMKGSVCLHLSSAITSAKDLPGFVFQHFDILTIWQIFFSIYRGYKNLFQWQPYFRLSNIDANLPNWLSLTKAHQLFLLIKGFTDHTWHVHTLNHSLSNLTFLTRTHNTHCHTKIYTWPNVCHNDYQKYLFTKKNHYLLMCNRLTYNIN